MRTLRCTTQVAFLTFWSFCFRLALADDLYQEYCSSQNTGSSYPRFYWEWQSNGKCATHCSGYAFGIVQGYYCWCSNYIPSIQTSVSQCNLSCYGFPPESCGNPDTGLFGYIPLGNHPSGTAIAAGVAQTSRPESSQNTVKPKTVQSSVTTSMISSASSTSRPTSTPTSAPSAVTSVERITVSGAVVTHYITSVPPSAPSANTIPVSTTQSSGLSNGAVAGITIGVIAAIAIIAGLLFCFCFWLPRKRRRAEEDGNSPSTLTSSNRPPQRESSVLSRVGLLGASRPSMVRPLPRILTGGFGGVNTDPNSNSQTISPMSQRRNSQPMFIDNRLNPNAIMSNSNTSHTSISTLQDNQDYSRPVLSVRNPDEH